MISEFLLLVCGVSNCGESLVRGLLHVAHSHRGDRFGVAHSYSPMWCNEDLSGHK